MLHNSQVPEEQSKYVITYSLQILSEMIADERTKQATFHHLIRITEACS